jgi:hypothetical protein
MIDKFVADICAALAGIEDGAMILVGSVMSASRTR